MSRLGALLLFAAVPMFAAPSFAFCPADCNSDGVVEIHELTRAVGISLGRVSYRLCPPADEDGDGNVVVSELVRGIGSGLHGCPATVAVHRAPELEAPAGPQGTDRGVLPNGRYVVPAGRQLELETFPLNVALTPNGRSLLVTNDGWGNQEGERGLQVIDLQTSSSTLVEVPHFFGLAATDDAVYLADGDDNRVERLRFEGDNLVRDSEPLATFPAGTYPTGLALGPGANRLYVVGLTNNSLWSIDLAGGGATQASEPFGNFPYTVIVSSDGSRAYVSSWGLNNANPLQPLLAPLPAPDPNIETMSSVAVVDLSNPDAPRLDRYVPIGRSLAIDNRKVFGGSHPSAMRLSPDGTLLYVTATNLDLLVVLDTSTLETVAEVALNVFDEKPLADQLQGFYPNALAVSADGRRVYVADAGINAVQVIDVDPKARTFVPAGFIPTGWFPTALALGDDDTLYVANGKGTGIGPNGGELIDINQITTSSTPYYIGRLVKGSLSVIENVASFDLDSGTETVAAANGLPPVELAWTDGEPESGQIQRRGVVPAHFDSGPSDEIQHVVFILKENRTYDQLYGDLESGNGDPSLTLFGEDITPNHHALAREFATGDNFFNDGEVSIPGHEWTDEANDTDFTEKLWPRNYNGNLNDLVVQYGQEGFAKGGYIFEALERQGVSYRVYGETFAFLTHFAAGIDGGGPSTLLPALLDAFNTDNPLVVVANLPALLNGDIDELVAKGVDVDELQNQVWPNVKIGFPANILANKTDVSRAEMFLDELAQFDEQGEMPSFVFIWLPNDHTFGAAPHMPTPDSALADNDHGLGMIVDGLTHSRFWPKMAIFVSEDDAQDGQDHVSAHRTISLVISPYVKRGYVSHVHHSNVSMLKTMELLLGVSPLSQYDLYATDMRDYFVSEPDLTPYVARASSVAAAVNPTVDAAPNLYLRRAAELSTTLNLEVYDQAGENLSRVLWLAHIGKRIEWSKRWAGGLVFGSAGLLLLAGATVGRRHAHRIRTPRL